LLYSLNGSSTRNSASPKQGPHPFPVLIAYKL
jgi:hypothetical protein